MYDTGSCFAFTGKCCNLYPLEKMVPVCTSDAMNFFGLKDIFSFK